ncbi:11834_t:CDS:2 [Funneliformis mosseae]|uniref:11834_t:CDS:1 n=1 Tax=Funneliformis mosseae TaxID=27381 RepID=A0A9N9DE44_FUNMO|nr:11834_t:CDS:2 [Funneliformis mosseae]
MTAVLRSTNFLTFKIPDNKKAHSYFKNVEARYWQLKHYLGFRLKTDEIILPWNTVYDDWRQTLAYIFKDYYKIVPSSVSAFCKDLYYICDTFEAPSYGKIVKMFSERTISEVLRMSNKKRLVEAESSSGKRARHFTPESELSDLCNNQEENIDEYETRSQEMNTILSNFRTYQHETRNILSENGIMDLSPTSEFMFPEEAHKFLTNFFSEKLNEDQWEEKLEGLMEVKGNPESFCQQSGENSGQDKFIIILKRFLLETLPILESAKDREMAEDEYMNTFVHPILKKALFDFLGSDIGNKAIKASAYRKTVMNQDGNADRADGIAYTTNQQNSYEISVTEGSRPYVIEMNKETNDFIQNARAEKDMINFAVTREVLHKRALPSYFRTFMVQVFEFNLRFYFMDYLAQYCIFEIETCEIPTDGEKPFSLLLFTGQLLTWALLVGKADKKFQESRNKRSSRLSNCNNIRKLVKLLHNNARKGKKKGYDDDQAYLSDIKFYHFIGKFIVLKH